MSNIAKGVVRLNNKYSFKFTNNTMCELEDAIDMDMSEIAEKFNAEQMSWRAVRAIVWAGLLHQFEDEYGNFDFTLKDAGRVMDEFGFDVVLEKAMDAFDAFMPEDDEDGEEKPSLNRPKANREQRRKGI